MYVFRTDHWILKNLLVFSFLEKIISSALSILELLVVVYAGLVLYDFSLSTLEYLLVSSSVSSCLGSHMRALPGIVSYIIRKHSLTENLLIPHKFSTPFSMKFRIL